MQCIAQAECVLGEGPVWVEREKALYWVDIVGEKLFRWSEAGGTKRIDVERAVTAIAPRQSGGWVAGMKSGAIGLLHAGFAIERELALGGEPQTNRTNDGKIDREGRFWVGTMDGREREASGSLFRLGSSGGVDRLDQGYRVTNGPAFSRDGRTLYHTDSALQTIYAFDLDGDGELGERRVFRRFSEGEGYPDGMTVDAEDCLWVAFWDGWCVRRIDPSGTILEEIAVPVQRPTSCAFGGTDMRSLFITSARRDLDEEALAGQPDAGGVFMADVGVTGIAELPFAG